MLISARISTQVLIRLSRWAARKSVPLTRAAVTFSCGAAAGAGAVDVGAGSVRAQGPLRLGPLIAGSALQADLRRRIDRSALGLGDAPELGILEPELAGD